MFYRTKLNRRLGLSVSRVNSRGRIKSVGALGSIFVRFFDAIIGASCSYKSQDQNAKIRATTGSKQKPKKISHCDSYSTSEGVTIGPDSGSRYGRRPLRRAIAILLGCTQRQGMCSQVRRCPCRLPTQFRNTPSARGTEVPRCADRDGDFLSAAAVSPLGRS
jgi:hypothetical protein